MNLKEELKKHYGQYIKIGAACNFVYCEICNENIESVIKKLSNDTINAAKAKLRKSEKIINNFDEYVETQKRKMQITIENNYKSKLKKIDIRLKKSIKETEKREDLLEKDKADKIEALKNKASERKEEALLKYEEAINELPAKIEVYKIKLRKYHSNIIKNQNKYIEGFIPFLEREVKDVYDSIQNENEIIILITGKEKGLYCSRFEYDIKILGDEKYKEIKELRKNLGPKKFRLVYCDKKEWCKYCSGCNSRDCARAYKENLEHSRVLKR